METEVNAEDVFNILVASDIHLGYAEKDPIRGDDSFIAFEEILSLAVEKKVDFVLLGGDLFHDNKPSQRCLHRCITLLRRYCTGDNPVKFEFLSDQSTNFGQCPFPNVNYEDPNLNISLPIFSIHGNHDDPSGSWHLGSMDILSATGLINYFGCCTNLQKIEVRPLLLRKGSSRLAIFGLGSIKDERLSRLLSQSKVEVLRPKVNADDWFNLMVLHQNHVIRGTSQNSYIPEAALPSFLDFIIWGHEHECIETPNWNPSKQFFVLQPGSSVATSLSEGESILKHAFLLHVTEKKFLIDKIPLQTVRPFVFDTMHLSCFDSLQPEDEDKKVEKGKRRKDELSLSKKVEEHVSEHVETLIMQAISKRTGHPKQPKKPLIRLRVEYNHQDQVFNPVRVGLNFMDQIANPNDMILLKREATQKGRKIKEEADSLDEGALYEAAERAREQQGLIGEVRVETVVEQYFQRDLEDMDDTIDSKAKQLKVLSVKGLIEGVTRYVDKQEPESLSEVFKHQVCKTVDHLKKEDVPGDEDSVIDGLQRFRLMREQNRAKDDEEVINHLNSKKKRTKATGKTANQAVGASSGEESDGEMDVDNVPSQRGRGRGAARSRARGRGGRQGRGKRAVDYDEDMDDDIQDVATQRSRATPRSRARGRGGRGRGNASPNKPQLSFLQNKTHDSFVQSHKTSSRVMYISSSDED